MKKKSLELSKMLKDTGKKGSNKSKQGKSKKSTKEKGKGKSNNN